MFKRLTMTFRFEIRKLGDRAKKAHQVYMGSWLVLKMEANSQTC